MKQADAEGLGDGKIVHVVAQRFAMGFFSCHHEYAAGDEADEDRFYGKQIGLDEVMEQIPYGQDGNRAGGDVNQRQARIGAPPVFPPQQGPPAVEMQHGQDFFFIYDRHGHDGPQLDKDFEYAGLLAVIAQQMADENHMARRRYGQEFRCPFDDAQDDGDNIVIHDESSLFCPILLVFIDEPAAGLFHADPVAGNAGFVEVGVFVFMDQKHYVVVLRQVFNRHEGHDVLGIPADVSRKGVFDFIGPFQPLGVIAGVIGQRYGIAPAVDGNAGTAVGHTLYGLGGIISRRLPAQGYGDEEGHDQIEGNANRRQNGDEALMMAQVRSKGDGNRNHVRERIGHVFRSHALVKHEDDDGPGHEELFLHGQGICHAAQASKASRSQTSSQLVNRFIFLCGQRQREYPGKEA